MLSSSAFNAFLKTLEEPPKHAIFILATTEKHKIIPTILSRCQIFDFKRISVKDAKEYLKHIAENQGVEADDDALHIIAQKADGAMRDALSIFDRVVSFSGKNLTRQAVTENLNVLDYEVYFTVTDLILSNNIPQLLLKFNEVISRGFDGHHFISGLASHFRDLMVCTNKETIQLLEVGDTTKQQYLGQSQKTSLSFLMKALDISNECDLKYKTSKNQRLLVELCLMQLASINFDGEKKNDHRFIIPVSHFRKNNDSTSNLKEETTGVELPDKKPIESIEDKEKNENEVTSPKIKLKNLSDKRVSGLSLSSIKAKKEHEKTKVDNAPDKLNLPKDKFTEEEMVDAWNEYVKIIDGNGKKILSSALHTDVPKLKDKSTIWIELPNDTMKKEVERDQYLLIQHLKEKLNNYDIDLYITVNEAAEQKYAFTPQEKYEKLKEKNPLIDKLRKEFDLDL